MTLSGVNQGTPAGRLVPKAYIYYFEHDVNPKDNDLILEIEWKGNNPIRILDKQEISYSAVKRGKNGRVEFYQVYTRSIYKGSEDDAALTEH
jgi:hypothetical protein